MTSQMKSDPTLALQGELNSFFFNVDDISSVPTFGGAYGVLIPDTLTVNLGDLSPLNIPSTSEPNKFVTVRVVRGAPDLGEFSLIERYKRNVRSALERMAQTTCSWGFFLPLNGCTRPDDIDSWDSVLLVYGAYQQSLEYGTLRQFDGNDPLEITAPFSFLASSRVFPVLAGEQADSVITSKVIDVMFADALSCGNCVPYSSGEQAWYALTNQSTGSPGLPSRVIGTTDGGSTYNASTINSLGTGQANKFAAVGSYIVAVSQTDESHHICLKSSLFVVNSWSEVSTGYVASSGPRCITSLSPQLTFMGAAAGYIYKCTDVTAGVSVSHDGSLTSQPCNSIHGDGQVILSGHDSNVLLLSTNQGATWRALTGPVVGQNVNAVWVINATTFWVAMANGKLYYTADGGSNWTQRLLPDQSNITSITDIKFSPDMPLIGALTVQKGATAAAIYRTLTGGRRWSYQTPYITNLSTAPATLGAVALAGVDKIIAGGEQTAASDGILIVAS